VREQFPHTRYHAPFIMSPNKSVQADNTHTTQPRRQIPHEQIAARAEKLWRDRDCPAGSDEAIWLEAESQLQGEAESRPVAGTPSRPYIDEPAKPVRTRTKGRDPSEAAVQTRSGTESKAKKTGGQLRNQ
jgi:hypothetical protein